MRTLRTVTIGAVAVAAALAAGASARAQFGPTPVYLEPVEKRMIRRSVELVGTAEARRRGTIDGEVAGRVERLLVDEGDYVKAGATVAELRKRPAEIQLRRAEAQLAAAQAELRKLEDGYRPEEIAQAEARLKAAQAHLQRWQPEYERTKKLLEEGASTPAEMEVVEASFRQARETVAEAEASLRLLQSGYRQEDIQRARETAGAYEATVEELKDALSKMTVTMPYDAIVVQKRCEVGQWLSAGSPVVEVIDLNVVRVRLDVPERFFDDVRKGADAPVVFGDLSNGEFKGTVSQVVPSSAEATHTLIVRVDVENTIRDGRPAIAAGLFARVWLPIGDPHEALLVPKDAVVRQMGRDVVYTISDTPPAAANAGEPSEGRPNPAEAPPPVPGEPPQPPVKYAVAVPIRILQGHGRYMEVEGEHLKPGMPLVTRGTYLMAPGAPVQIRPKEQGGEGGGRGRAGAAPRSAGEGTGGAE